MADISNRPVYGSAPAEQQFSYKLDAPFSAEFAWIPQENKLVQRVAEAREAGLSYGQYMARLYEEKARAK